MIETLTMRCSKDEWLNDLDLGLGNIGVYRMKTLKNLLIRNMSELSDLINNYESLRSFTIVPYKEDNFWFGMKVLAEGGYLPFYAYVFYGVDEKNKLFAEIYYTSRPTTEEFPIEGGVEWKTDRIYESEIKDTRYVVANLKNSFIIYESYKRIGREIIYSVLEE